MAGVSFTQQSIGSSVSYLLLHDWHSNGWSIKTQYQTIKRREQYSIKKSDHVPLNTLVNTFYDTLFKGGNDSVSKEGENQILIVINEKDTQYPLRTSQGKTNTSSR